MNCMRLPVKVDPLIITGRSYFTTPPGLKRTYVVVTPWALTFALKDAIYEYCSSSHSLLQAVQQIVNTMPKIK